MLNVQQIKNMKKGEPGVAILAVVHAEVRETQRKSKFLNLTLGDKNGAIGGKIWDWSQDSALDIGTVIQATFEFSPFNDVPQIAVRDFSVMDKSKLDVGLFIDSLTPEQFKSYRSELEKLVASIKNENLRTFVSTALFKIYPQFMSAPGSKQMHHARLGGLMEHTVHVTRNALALANTYRDNEKWKYINTDFLIAGALLHDLGKIYDYSTDKLVIDYDLAFTFCGQHGTNPALLQEIWIATERKLDWNMVLALMHIQISHHGPEFSLVPPSTFSAWLIHCADLADAKVTLLSNSLDDRLVTQEKIFGIGNRIVNERKLPYESSACN